MSRSFDPSASLPMRNECLPAFHLHTYATAINVPNLQMTIISRVINTDLTCVGALQSMHASTFRQFRSDTNPKTIHTAISTPAPWIFNTYLIKLRALQSRKAAAQRVARTNGATVRIHTDAATDSGAILLWVTGVSWVVDTGLSRGVWAELY